jgi:hypothetical protein
MTSTSKVSRFADAAYTLDASVFRVRCRLPAKPELQVQIAFTLTFPDYLEAQRVYANRAQELKFLVF